MKKEVDQIVKKIDDTLECLSDCKALEFIRGLEKRIHDKRIKYSICCYCSISKEDTEFRQNPYLAKTHNIKTLYPICDKCANDALKGIHPTLKNN